MIGNTDHDIYFVLEKQTSNNASLYLVTAKTQPKPSLGQSTASMNQALCGLWGSTRSLSQNVSTIYS